MRLLDKSSLMLDMDRAGLRAALARSLQDRDLQALRDRAGQRGPTRVGQARTRSTPPSPLSNKSWTNIMTAEDLVEFNLARDQPD